MPGDTENRKKRGALACALGSILFLGVLLAAVFWPLIGEAGGKGPEAAALMMVCALILAAILGILAALYQRLKEIKGGEEEDAGKY